jgi:hypothetical protein
MRLVLLYKSSVGGHQRTLSDGRTIGVHPSLTKRTPAAPPTPEYHAWLMVLARARGRPGAPDDRAALHQRLYGTPVPDSPDGAVT